MTLELILLILCWIFTSFIGGISVILFGMPNHGPYLWLGISVVMCNTYLFYHAVKDKIK